MKMQTQTARMPNPPDDQGNRSGIDDVDSVLWRTYDDGGWERLQAEDFETAQRYFDRALPLVDDNELRMARTFAGQAWLAYRTSAKYVEKENREGNAPDANKLFQDANSLALKAARLFDGLRKQNKLPKSDEKYHAHACYIHGLTAVELCDGATAISSLESAATRYLNIRDFDRAYDVKHYIGKLYQCQKKPQQAAKIYRDVFTNSPTTERQARALLDYCNTLTWMGYVREARQLYQKWSDLKALLANDLDSRNGRPQFNLFFRGELLFGRIGIQFGEIAFAETQLRKAYEYICNYKISDLCQSVFWTIKGELALAKGNLHKAYEHLQNVGWKEEYPASGYDCLEILVYDLAVRRCVIECCTYETTYYNSCSFLFRRCQRIVFTEEQKYALPINAPYIHSLFVYGLQAQILFQQGDYKQAAKELQTVLDEIGKSHSTTSLVLLPFIFDLAESLQAQIVYPDGVRNRLNEVLSNIDHYGVIQHARIAEVTRLLSQWRSQLGEYDLATVLFEKAYKRGIGGQHPDSPDQIFLLAKRIEARMLDGKGSVADLDALRLLILKMQSVVYCYDFRLLQMKSFYGWMLVLTCNYSCGRKYLEELENNWHKKQPLEEIHIEVVENDKRSIRKKLQPAPDHRVYSVMAANLAAHFQQGVLFDEHVDDLFNRLYELTATQWDPMATAHELNRIGMVLKNHKHLDAAKHFFSQATKIYEKEGRKEYADIVRRNLEIVLSKLEGDKRK